MLTNILEDVPHCQCRSEDLTQPCAVCLSFIHSPHSYFLLPIGSCIAHTSYRPQCTRSMTYEMEQSPATPPAVLPKAALLLLLRSYLSEPALETLADLRAQFARMLADGGLVLPPAAHFSAAGGGWDDPTAPWNRYASRPAVVRTHGPCMRRAGAESGRGDAC